MRLVRYLSTKRKLAVIGSGPSAFYTILNILKEKPNEFEIDMFEKNPSPFGLVRYGVAPDHPEVKNCIDRFNDIQEFVDNGTFRYFGNVPVSTENSKLHLKDLYKNYNSVLYAYGSACANLPEFSGIEHPGVIDSYSLVNWYNGNPHFKDLKVPLEKAKNITVIGNGNVAIDIVRLLLANPDKHLKHTDISTVALEKLQKSAVQNINIVARRGILESKFTNKELREVLEMDEQYGVYFSGWNSQEFTEELKDVKLDRVNKRRVSLLDKFMNKFKKLEDKSKVAKTWNLQYLKSPIGIKVKDDSLLEDTLCTLNEVAKGEDGKWKIQPKNQLTSVANDLLILATGYKCKPLSEFKELNIPFTKGKIENVNGKVVGVDDSYCVGWVANGSQGNINSSLVDSVNASNTILEDLKDIYDDKKGRVAIESKLAKEGVKVISWEDWNKIHEVEKANGEKLGKPYDKLDFKDMVTIV